MPPVVMVDKDGNMINPQQTLKGKSTMALVQKIIMMEQELELLKKQKHEDEQGAAEEAEEKEIDAALGMMFNAV